MENVSSYKNPYQVQPNFEQKVTGSDSQENFTALDKEKLKEDSIELANTIDKNANESWLIRKLKGFGIKDPKKLLKAIAYTAITVVGLGVVGGKLSSPTFKLGQKVDGVFLSNNNIFGKIYSGLSNIAGKAKQAVSNMPKTKTMQDIADTAKNRTAKIKTQWGRGYERGPVGIFLMTVNDVVERVMKKSKNSFAKIMGEDVATKFLKDFENKESLDQQKLFSDLTDSIVTFMKKNHSELANKSSGEILDLMRKNKINGVDLSEFRNIKMTSEGLQGVTCGWWPVNIIDSIGSKIGQVITGNKNYQLNFGRGNLFDALIKFNAVNGTGAKTLPGKFVQKMVTVPTESISNFVNDKSGMGVFLTIPMFTSYMALQDIPKEKRAVNLGNDYASQVAHWTIVTPVTYSIIYRAICSMKNLEGTTIPSKLIKQAGRFFGMGLDYWEKDKNGWKFVTNNNKVTGFIGGAMRFALLMFILSPIVSKPITKVINKIIGKPYDPSEAQREKEMEEAKKQVIPELGITQEELLKKMQANPQVIQQIQQNPQIVKELEKNPKLLLDLLDGKQSTTNTSVNNQKPYEMSSLNKQLLERRKLANQATSNPINNQNNGNLSSATSQLLKQRNTNTPQNSTNYSDFSKLDKKPKNPKNPTQGTTENTPIDTATYIPSSEPVKQPESTLSNEVLEEYNAQMARADKVLKNAEKLLN